jgi:hypothetical protein
MVLNVHAPTEDKIDDVNDYIYEEIQFVLNNSLKCYLKI